MPTINFVRCLLLLLVISLLDCSLGERVNSSGGMVWSTARDEAEPVEDSGVVIGEQDQIDGGFSSLDGMLHWAIGKFIFPSVLLLYYIFSYRSDSTSNISPVGNSDPATLKEAAKDAEKMSMDELQKRQLELKVPIFFYFGLICACFFLESYLNLFLNRRWWRS